MLRTKAYNTAPNAYPELSALIGPHVPDLRGLFLRGYGWQPSYHYGETWHGSGNLGEIQGDATRPLSSEFNGMAAINGTGPFSSSYNIPGWHVSGGRDYSFGLGMMFNTAWVTPTAPENRPVNTAVRYLMRARP